MSQAPAVEIGSVFGRLTVIGEATPIHVGKRTKTVRRRWLCRCSCGTVKDVVQLSLVTGATASCGCLRKEMMANIGMARAAEIAGLRFRHLSVIRRADERDRRGRPMWICACDCGATVVARYVGRPQRLLEKSSCGCATSRLRSAAKTIHGDAGRGVSSAFYRMWLGARGRAKDKRLPFDLAFEAFRSWALDLLKARGPLCPILGVEMRANRGVRRADSMTLDRVRPELGYVFGNIDIISHRANQLKNDSSPDELRAVLRYLSERGVE